MSPGRIWVSLIGVVMLVSRAGAAAVQLGLAPTDLSRGVNIGISLRTFNTTNCSLSELPVFSDKRFTALYNLNIILYEEQNSMFLLATRTGEPASSGFVVLELNILRGVGDLTIKNVVSVPGADSTAVHYMPTLYLDTAYMTGSIPRLLVSSLVTNSSSSWICVQHIPLDGKDAYKPEKLVEIPFMSFDGEFPSGSFQVGSRRLVFSVLQLSGGSASSSWQSTGSYVGVDVDEPHMITVKNQTELLCPNTLPMICKSTASTCKNFGVAFAMAPSPLGPPCQLDHALLWTRVSDDLDNIDSFELPKQPYDDCVTYVTAQQYSAASGTYTALVQTPLGNYPLTGILSVDVEENTAHWSACAWRKMQTRPAPIGLVLLPES